MSNTKSRDADVTQQIRVAREELDKAIQANARVNRRLCSTLPPKQADDTLDLEDGGAEEEDAVD